MLLGEREDARLARSWYTHPSGTPLCKRRLRMYILALATCNNIGELYRNYDQDTVFNYFSRWMEKELCLSVPALVVLELMLPECMKVSVNC